MAESSFDIIKQIVGGSTSATDWLSQVKANQLAAAAERTAALQNQIKGAGSVAGATGATPQNEAFGYFTKAIAQQESGGNYRALGSYVDGDRAYGKYQIMGNNIANWTKSALGTAMTPQQFLRDKAAQDATAKFHLWNYYKNYGPKRAAMAWNQGTYGMEQGWGKDYASEVMDRMRNYGYTKGLPTGPNPNNPNNSGGGGAYQGQSGWVSPIAGMGNPTSNYGWRTNPVSGQRSFHEGIDYGAAAGVGVRAARGGRIIESGWDPIYGNRVITRTPKGKEVLYGHLQNINERWGEGDTINPGQRLGRVGSTGWSTGPHLHFGIYGQGGGSIDPMKFINRMGQPGVHHNRPGGGGGNNQQQVHNQHQQTINNPNGKFAEILRNLGL